MYNLREALAESADGWRTLLESQRKLNPNAKILGLNCGPGYINAEEYVLRNGREYSPASLTDWEFGYVLEAVRRARKRGCAFEIKNCFNNAQRLVLASAGKLRYVEGYVRSVMPIHHAWATINDKVVDLTLRYGVHGRGPQRIQVPPQFHRLRMADRIYGIWYEEAAYMGCEFDRVDVLKHVLRPDVEASLIQTPERLMGKAI
jgi:hypothetical protein